MENLAAVHGFVTECAQDLGIPDRASHHFHLAAEEAFTNIVQHGSTGRAAGPFPITFEFASHGAGWTLTVRDRGSSFDPNALPPPDLKAGLRTRKAGGLGVYLIRSLMDDVRYASSDGENRLTLTKRRA